MILLLVTLPIAAQRFGSDDRRLQLTADEAASVAEQGIQSTDPEQQAWAAYLVGKHRLEPLYPKLIEKLQEKVAEPRNFQVSKMGVLLATLDAVVTIEIQVPVKLGWDVYQRFPDEGIISAGPRKGNAG